MLTSVWYCLTGGINEPTGSQGGGDPHRCGGMGKQTLVCSDSRVISCPSEGMDEMMWKHGRSWKRHSRGEMTALVLCRVHENVTMCTCVRVRVLLEAWECAISSQCFKEDPVGWDVTRQGRRWGQTFSNELYCNGPNGQEETHRDMCNSHLVSSHIVVAVWEHIACNTLRMKVNLESHQGYAGERKVCYGRRGRR